jgi:polyhydroxybutyrate depolymerase
MIKNTEFSIISMNIQFVGYNGSLFHQDMERTYHCYIPRRCQLGQPMPLVMVFHGGGQGTGERIAHVTGFNQLAEQKGFLVLYPNAIDYHWRDGREQKRNRLTTKVLDPSIDDVGFVDALIDKIQENNDVDSSRIYATGISSGGFFTQRLACELSDRIAAFASVASTFPTKLIDCCKPSRPVSILLIGSQTDPYVPWKGGDLHGTQILSVSETIDFWRKNNRCDLESEREIAVDFEKIRYFSCSSQSEVVLMRIIGGGHTWPGGRGQPRLIVGPTSQVDATATIWNFFERHSLSG